MSNEDRKNSKDLVAKKRICCGDMEALRAIVEGFPDDELSDHQLEAIIKYTERAMVAFAPVRNALLRGR